MAAITDLTCRAEGVAWWRNAGPAELMNWPAEVTRAGADRQVVRVNMPNATEGSRRYSMRCGASGDDESKGENR